MCGIAGKLSFEPGGRVDAVTVRRMCRVLFHRGPEDEGVHLDGELGMGMRRLKIIDLATGRQPMTNEDGTVWTVFNGEIYNYRELRGALESAGHRFVTNSDTEVIVHGYEQYGEGFVDQLTGMFAIAVWDARRRTLILARDRLGIKPLYYLVDSRRLLFASEIKALLQDGVPRDVDRQALHDYLALGYVPGPRSIFSAIRKVQPGHLLVCTQDGAVERRYWRLTYPAATAPRSEASYAEELRALLKRVTAEHLLSDVPLGVFLSGGVDSSTLVALMRELAVDPLRTFSIGFDERSYDELDHARVVARAFDTDHHELVVRPDAVSLLPELVRSFDEPFADSSAIPVSCVSRLARQRVTVALSGEGGDEVFGGYVTYRAYKVANLYRRLPSAVTTLLPALVRRLPTSHRRVSFDYRAKRFVEGAFLPPADAHCWWKLIFDPDAADALYATAPPLVGDAGRLYRESWESCDAPDALTRLQHIDLGLYLPDDLLVKADRMSMAASLEVRVPFVDHRIVEFAASLPPDLKVRRLTTKYILKRAMAGTVPSRILSGKKRGFNVPIAAWLMRELREMVHDVLSETRVRRAGFFDPAAVSALIRAHEARQADYSRNIYALLMFSLWSDEYLRRPVEGQPAEALTLGPRAQPSPANADIRVGVSGS
jgi:asparagine synthase (glutamine-hydrolysing)